MHYFKKFLTLLQEKKKYYLSVYKTLNPEKVILLWVFLALTGIFIFSSLIIFNKQFLIKVPTYGGTIYEGLIGTPRFINPVLATTEQDRSLTTLVFSGLTKEESPNYYALDLAEYINQSEDGLQYDVKIKKEAVFHDGKPVTSDDIIFTIDKIQNPIIKSPQSIKWEGVIIEKKDDKNLLFTLKKPFPLFMETLSVGILPKHVWKDLDNEQFSLSNLNIQAIGSGPYKIKNIINKSGLPTEITLTSFEKYTRGKPYIDTIEIVIAQNEKSLLQAFKDNDIHRIPNVSPQTLSSLEIASSTIQSALLPRNFILFMNPNKKEILADKNIRKALDMSLDKEKIVAQVLGGYGKPLSSPYSFDSMFSSAFNIEEAKNILSANKDFRSASSSLELTLVTANTEEMRQTAEIIKNNWAKVGINVTIKIYDLSDLTQTIIKERDFEVLLFGAITETPSDLYAFWHSNQRNYPGLNISNYVSKTLDANLETVRNSIIEDERSGAYTNIVEEFKEETPGIFIFAPSFIYITNDDSNTILPSFIKHSSDRFNLVEQWYVYYDYVWPNVYYKKTIESINLLLN
jgi:peptide/nickel transport system substrate-binding protein